MKKGLFFTEASRKVGYGHLMECIAIAEKCNDDLDISFCLLHSDNRAVELLAEKKFHVIRIGGDNKDINTKIPQNYDWIFLNTRDNSYSLQKSLISRADRFIILDELGRKRIKCHSLINFSINDQWHEYEYEGDPPSLFFGIDYYPIRDSLKKALEKPTQKKGSVLVTLGGADRTNTTLRIANILGKLRDTEVTYIIGPGSALNKEDVIGVLGKLSHQKVEKSPRRYDELLSSHQFIISAGGNTLYEAAFLKKTILIVWEDAHEKIQGEFFEKKGLARVVGGADYINTDCILKILSDSNEHNKQKNACDTVIDGQGLHRIVSIIEGANQN